MLISYKYKFIFVHIYKNAGSSISAALLPYTFYNSAHRLYYKAAHKLGMRILNAINPQPMAGHASAAQIAEKIGIEKFKAYFSFAIVRNPWDWQVSLYSFSRKNSKHRQHKRALQFESFSEYIRWRCAEEVHFQKDYICDAGGAQLVSFAGRYENLTQDFKTICEHIGIQAELPVLNVSKSRPYQEYYTPETVELVRKNFAPDIELFGYDFE